MKRVLLTGATGFVGRHCLVPLLEHGYEVHAVHLRRIPDVERIPGIHWHRGDLLEDEATHILFRTVRPTHLLHLAWYVEPKKFWAAPENLSWVAATAKLLRSFSDNGGERAVLAGTCAEYDWHYGLCSEQFTPCKPATLYGASKYATQVLFEAWAQEAGISGAWGRVFFLYGPHQHSSYLVRSIITNLLNDQAAPCTEGTQRRDFMHIQDAANAFVALLESRVTAVVNIASGYAVEVRALVSQIAEQLNRPHLLHFGAIPGTESEPFQIYADIARLRDEVGFHPHFDLDGGITHTIEWAKRTHPSKAQQTE